MVVESRYGLDRPDAGSLDQISGWRAGQFVLEEVEQRRRWEGEVSDGQVIGWQKILIQKD